MAGDFEVLDLALPHVRMRALAWGSKTGRLALCLHGFPDSAHGWRLLAPMLVANGFRVVAPFTRGYWPTEMPKDASFHMGALMHDALAVHRHLGGGEDAVLIGHDWGAWTTNALAASPNSPFAAHISLAVPPILAIDRADGGVARQLALGLRQLRRSWYVLFFQIPWLPEMLLHRIIPKLWRDWTPAGIKVQAGVADALAALPTVAYRAAAVSYYRSMARWWTRPSPECDGLHRARFSLPTRPMLVLHGRQDGAVQVGYLDNVINALPAGSRVEIIDGAGHFLQLDRPDAVCAEIIRYLDTPASRGGGAIATGEVS